MLSPAAHCACLYLAPGSFAADPTEALPLDLTEGLRQTPVAYLEICKGAGYISGVHFQKCSKLTIIFFHIKY